LAAQSVVAFELKQVMTDFEPVMLSFQQYREVRLSVQIQELGEHLMLPSASFVSLSLLVLVVKMFLLDLTRQFESAQKIVGYQVWLEQMLVGAKMTVGLVLWLSDLGTAFGIVLVPRNMFL
jgi:ABC-type Na+ efflux pump permease subunit